jgi:hypothetical protein
MFLLISVDNRQAKDEEPKTNDVPTLAERGHSHLACSWQFAGRSYYGDYIIHRGWHPILPHHCVIYRYQSGL